MGSLAAPHFVHSSARIDAEGAKRGSLDRSDLKRNSAFFVRRSHTTSQYLHTGLTSPVIRPCTNQRKRKIAKVGLGKSAANSFEKLSLPRFSARINEVHGDDAAPSRISFSTRSTSAGTSTLIASLSPVTCTGASRRVGAQACAAQSIERGKTATGIGYSGQTAR